MLSLSQRLLMPALLPSRRWKVLSVREGRRGIQGLRFLPRCRSLRHADRRVSRLRMTRSLRHRFQADRTHYPSRALHLMVRCQKWSDLPLRSRVRPRYRPVELGSLGGVSVPCPSAARAPVGIMSPQASTAASAPRSTRPFGFAFIVAPSLGRNRLRWHQGVQDVAELSAY